MWKCASRSLRSIFFKSQCNQCNINAREARYARNCNSFLKFTPTLLGHFKRAYGDDKSKFTKNENKENPNTDRGYRLHDLHNHIADALHWGGIFVLGWYLVQPLTHKRALFNHSQSENCAFTILTKYTKSEYFKFVEYLKGSITAFHYVLPKVEAKNSKNKYACLKDFEPESEYDQTQYKELEEAHSKVVGALSNIRGAQCMAHGKYSEAICHFEDGAQLLNPASIYNLGVCYESGLGTDQDFKKAAKFYKKASDLGHSTATYNLGVFYVHGFGDLRPDMNEARKLFKLAASQGQPNAKKALDLESNGKNSSKNKISSSENSANNLNTDDSSNQSSKEPGKFGNFDIYRLLKIKMETNFDNARFENDDSGALDLSP